MNLRAEEVRSALNRVIIISFIDSRENDGFSSSFRELFLGLSLKSKVLKPSNKPIPPKR